MTRIKHQQQKLRYGTSIIDYSIVRSRRRKTSEIIVDEENVIVLTPYNKSIEEINDIVREKAKWITTKQSEFKSASPEIVQPVFEEGSTLRYLGRNYLLRFVIVQQEIKSNENIKLVNGEFLIFSKSSRPPKKRIMFLYEKWLRKKADSIFEQNINFYCTELGIKPPQLVVKNLKNRWGSATKENVINLNVNLLKAPESVIKCIILHELCHLKIKEHSHHFWDMLHKFMPDYQVQVDWLRINGSRLV
jgi:predicted metal-dependent hydrolase